jgi:hypothetical protein
MQEKKIKVTEEEITIAVKEYKKYERFEKMKETTK